MFCGIFPTTVIQVDPLPAVSSMAVSRDSLMKAVTLFCVIFPTMAAVSSMAVSRDSLMKAVPHPSLFIHIHLHHHRLWRLMVLFNMNMSHILDHNHSRDWTRWAGGASLQLCNHYPSTVRDVAKEFASWFCIATGTGYIKVAPEFKIPLLDAMRAEGLVMNRSTQSKCFIPGMQSMFASRLGRYFHDLQIPNVRIVIFGMKHIDGLDALDQIVGTHPMAHVNTWDIGTTFTHPDIVLCHKTDGLTNPLLVTLGEEYGWCDWNMANMRVIAYPKLTHWMKASTATTSWSIPSNGSGLHRQKRKYDKLMTQLLSNRFNLGGIRVEVQARARTSRDAIDIVIASGALDRSILSRYRPNGDQLKLKYIPIPDYLALVDSLSRAAVRNGLWTLRDSSALPHTRVSQLRDYMNAFGYNPGNWPAPTRKILEAWWIAGSAREATMLDEAQLHQQQVSQRNVQHCTEIEIFVAAQKEQFLTHRAQGRLRCPNADHASRSMSFIGSSIRFRARCSITACR
ncbi:hypothetical protein DFS34DRAFT_664006 [Phlyctochytrium arcticum]|nr:hypothetical protein DFS34DRAFT_664006 [Phlyctochytrium arcticum]